MRKEAKVYTPKTMAVIQGYHAGAHGEAYAFAGFNGNYYFKSDRYCALDDQWQRTDKVDEPLKGFGLEIELECCRIGNQERVINSNDALAEILSRIVFSEFKWGDKLFKMQRDGSLGEVSAECITQIMTEGYIRNNYKAFKAMYDHWFKLFGISCSKTGHCGMHVNISNAVFGKTKEQQDEAIRKLYYIINKHFDLCCKLLNREGSTHYCGRMNYSVAKTMNLSGFCSDHYQCMNLGHYNTGRIELRLVGGQSTYGCFRNTMESVFFLCQRVQTISWKDCDNVEKVFKGCNQYVFDRLQSKCNLDIETLMNIKNTVKTEQLL